MVHCVFTCNVVVVHHFMILLCEWLSADLARCCRIVACHFVICQGFHTLLVGYNCTNYQAFVHHVLVKFIHNVWTGVDRGFRLVCFVFRDTITRKSTNVIYIFISTSFVALTASTSSSSSAGERNDSKLHTK